MVDPVTVASILAGSASIVVSAAAVGTYRQASRFMELTEQNRRDLRGAEPEDDGLVHTVRENRAVLTRYGMMGATEEPHQSTHAAPPDLAEEQEP